MTANDEPKRPSFFQGSDGDAHVQELKRQAEEMGMHLRKKETVPGTKDFFYFYET